MITYHRGVPLKKVTQPNQVEARSVLREWIFSAGESMCQKPGRERPAPKYRNQAHEVLLFAGLAGIPHDEGWHAHHKD